MYLDEKLTDVEVTVDRGFRRLSDGVSFIGVAQVTILPPDSIFVPFLPVTVGGKNGVGSGGRGTAAILSFSRARAQAR